MSYQDGEEMKKVKKPVWIAILVICIAVLIGGAIFLMLADLTARMILRPLELNVGVVTSFVGAILFVYIYFKTRRTR